MTKKIALGSAAGIGLLLGLLGMPFGLQPLEVIFASIAILFTYAVTALFFFSATSWPYPSYNFDFYDFSKCVIGACITCALATVALATALKVSNVFSLNFVTAGLLTFTGFIVYGAMATVLLARKRR